MAASLTLVSASPNALKYEYAYDGSASMVATVLQAQLVLDAKTAAQGPSAIAPVIAGLASMTNLQQRPDLSLYVTPTSQTNAAAQVSAAGSSISGGLTVTGLGQANGDKALIELRFNHTFDR